MGSTTKLKRYAFGVSFVGRFASQKQADKACGEVEKYLTLEKGYSEVRGGGTRQNHALCGCDEPGECDKRAGCLFVSYAHDDYSNDPDDEDDEVAA